MGIPVGGIVEVVPSWLDGPELAEAVLHYKIKTESSNDPEQDLTNLASAVNALVGELTETCMTTTSQLVGCSARVLPPTAGAGRIYTYFGTVTGAVSSEVSGAQIAALVSKYTTGYERTDRGRMYVPFVPESFVISGQITDDGRTAYLAALYPFLLNDVSFSGGGVLEPVVYSRKLGTAKDVTDVILRPVVCTQRRRVFHRQPFSPVV